MAHRVTGSLHVPRAASRFAAVVLAALAISLLGCRSLDGADRPVRVVTFGDSMTAGPTDRSYPDFLAEALSAPPDAVVAAGRSGETAAEGVVRLTKVLRAQPRRTRGVLIYWEGGNDVNRFIRRHDRWLRHDPAETGYPHARLWRDTLKTIEQNVVRAVRMARRRRFDVFVVTYPPVRASLLNCDAMPGGVLLAGQAQRANRYVDLLNASLRRAAAAGGARVVDVAVAFPADAQNYDDCIHPSEAGHEIIAGIVAESLRRR